MNNQNTTYSSSDLIFAQSIFTWSIENARRQLNSKEGLIEVLHVFMDDTLSRRDKRNFVYYNSRLDEAFADLVWSKYMDYELNGFYIPNKELIEYSKLLNGDVNDWERVLTRKLNRDNDIHDWEKVLADIETLKEVN